MSVNFQLQFSERHFDTSRGELNQFTTLLIILADSVNSSDGAVTARDAAVLSEHPWLKFPMGKPVPLWFVCGKLVLICLAFDIVGLFFKQSSHVGEPLTALPADGYW